MDLALDDDPGVALEPCSPASATTRPLVIEGWVKRPLRMHARDLEALGPTTVPDFEIICTADGSHGVAPPMRGVLLRDLVTLAEPAFRQRTDFKRVALVAEGRDGYRALFSWSELFHSMIGDGVLLVFDHPQAPLPANAGPFALISRYDRFTGPRYLRGLRKVELHRLW